MTATDPTTAQPTTPAELDLDAIESRYRTARDVRYDALGDDLSRITTAYASAADVPALTAEVRRLRSELDAAGRVLDAAREWRDLDRVGGASSGPDTVLDALDTLAAAVDALDAAQPAEPAPEPDSGPGWDREGIQIAAHLLPPKLRAEVEALLASYDEAAEQIAELRGLLAARKAERDAARAELATARQALGDIASLAATAAPADDITGTIDRLGEIVRLAQEAARPVPGSPQPAEGGEEPR